VLAQARLTFSRRMQRSPDMAATRSTMLPMRCRGCGGKTSSRVLSDVLNRLQHDQPNTNANRDERSSGFLQAEDAAILSSSAGPVNALTVDFFPAFTNDHWLTGRIAALHALSDLYASGAQPTAALAIVTLPEGDHQSQRDVLYQLLAGATRELSADSVQLVGGHTIDGDELAIGFCVAGRCSEASIIRKGRISVGQTLILTKPLGTGVILAAAALARAPAKAVQVALDMMLISNRLPDDFVSQFGITGMTDVTGFGLAGHLQEMLSPTGCCAELNPGQLPVLDGVMDLLRAGHRSSLNEENWRNVAATTQIQPANPVPPEGTELLRAVLCDPQTSGGLLVAVDSQHEPAAMERLGRHGLSPAVIGHILPPRSDGILIQVGGGDTCPTP
ncbi:MAG: selenide, water dikinase SelD, partial [Planctomycetaceae bacterium]|nr:selenide, water dikinase SelD [Planctomycetaceae bacterium]